MNLIVRAGCLLKCCGLVFVGLQGPRALAEADWAYADQTKALWRPVADQPYLQEVGEQIRTKEPVTGLAVLGRNLFAVVGGELNVLKNHEFVALPEAPKKVHRLRALSGALWAATDHGLFHFGGREWRAVSNGHFVDFCLHLGAVYGATTDAVFQFQNGEFVSAGPAGGYLSSDTTVVMEDFSQVLADPVELGPIQRIASYSGTIYLLRKSGLALIDGRTFVPDPIDWGVLPSPVTRDLLAQGSRLYAATERGLGVLRGMAMEALRGAAGLCYEDTTCLAHGFEGDLWIGTTRGAIRHVENEFHYFGADHWLPADQVYDIAVGERTAYVATSAGVGVIRYEPFTLAQKAAYFEREVDAWGFKRLGFVHKLYWSERDNGWVREISDNDGGHTSHYLAAMSFKYAATGDEEARREAVESFNAMLWLGDICAQPGFIARAVWSATGDRGERSTRGSGGLPAKWYPTEDGRWFWKGDTSSDEVNAHFYSVSLFHDLAARGKEKERAKAHLSSIATHIIENGWLLRDVDGKPTRWGRWDPKYLQTPYGYEARGLNGMEAQTYVQTAYAITGDEKFKQALQQLLNWRYHTYTVRQRLTFPPDQVVPWDDGLAFFCYPPLLRYTEDPELRSIYLRSLERTWEIVRRQHVPFFNFVYGSLTGNDCEIPETVRHLREWPVDLVNHDYRNSHRQDLHVSSANLLYMGGKRAISPRESEAKMDVRYSLQYDGGENGKAVTPPISWLEDYWMGRYYGFIKAPSLEGEPKALALPKNHPKAVAYTGPERPRRD